MIFKILAVICYIIAVTFVGLGIAIFVNPSLNFFGDGTRAMAYFLTISGPFILINSLLINKYVWHQKKKVK